jgi:steroid delta-isomerase-like uncharacterized protein
MAAAEALRVVQGYLAGHGLEWLSEDVEFWDTTRPAPMHGRDEVGGYLHRFFVEAFDEARIDEVRLTPGGDRVCAEWTFRGRHAGSLAGEPATGHEVVHLFAAVYEVANGEICRARVYHDSAGLVRQLGIEP